MSGTLQATIIKDGASATNNITLDGSGNATIGNNLTVTGAFTSAVTAPSFIPTGSTVPANGMYLSAANTLNLATNTTNQVSISSGGIVTGTAGNLMLVQGTSQASTSGTSIDFTGIPSWAKRITVMFSGVSTSGTSNIQIQIGSGSVTTSGYVSAAGYAGSTNAAGSGTITSGHGIDGLNSTAAWARYGSCRIENITGNAWVFSHSLGLLSSGVPYFIGGGGISPALSGALDRIRITTVNGTDTFDAGTINIQYE